MSGIEQAVAVLGTVIAGFGVYVSWRKAFPRPQLRIDQPSSDTSGHEWVVVVGTGAPRNWKVLLLTALLDSGPIPANCWLQPGEADPDPRGGWRLRCHLKSPRDRLVYAIAVRATQVERVRALFRPDIGSVADFARILKAAHIRHKLSEGKRLQKVQLSA
jgi:hypothetical protein